MSPRTGRRRAPAAVLAALAVAALTACGAGGAPDQAGTSAAAATTEDRLTGDLWLNPDGHAAVAARQAREQGRTAEAEVLAPLADQPTATWFANPGNPYAEVAALSEAAAAAGQVPVLVSYFVPVRDCRSYSAGGAPDADAYLSWVGSLAAALGDRPAVVVLEPDAVAHAVVGCEGVAPEQRYEMLARAVEILGRQPAVRTYVDAGNATWVTDLPVLAAALRSSGVDDTAGFALNVANFQTTDDSARFGAELSRELERGAPAGTPPAHFVVDTSRNGAGPPAPDDGAGTAWCNPAGRRLGEAPTTAVDRDRVDALLWVKQPGDSDGTCAGGPPAGQFWLPAALELAGG